MHILPSIGAEMPPSYARKGPDGRAYSAMVGPVPTLRRAGETLFARVFLTPVGEKPAQAILVPAMIGPATKR